MRTQDRSSKGATVSKVSMMAGLRVALRIFLQLSARTKGPLKRQEPKGTVKHRKGPVRVVPCSSICTVVVAATRAGDLKPTVGTLSALQANCTRVCTISTSYELQATSSL